MRFNELKKLMTSGHDEKNLIKFFRDVVQNDDETRKLFLSLRASEKCSEEFLFSHLVALCTNLGDRVGASVGAGSASAVKNTDAFLTFDLVEFFSKQKTAENLSSLESLPDSENLIEICKIALGDREIIKALEIEVPAELADDYENYCKVSSQKVMQGLVDSLVKCDDLETDLQEYKVDCNSCASRLGSGDLSFVETIKSQSAIAERLEKHQQPATQTSQRSGESLASSPRLVDLLREDQAAASSAQR